MNTTSTTPDSASLGEGSQWPVLARLQHVTADVESVASRQDRAAAAGFVSYRFDPPENAERGMRSVDSVPRRSTEADEAGSGQPHILQSTSLARVGEASPILPRSNLFEIPDRRLTDAISPATRFLFTFALATVIGTSILTIRRHAQRVDEAMKPEATAAQPSLELHLPPTATRVIESQTSPPTALGPLGMNRPAARWAGIDRRRSASEEQHAASAPAAPRVAMGNWQLVPQVQDSAAGTTAPVEPAPATSEEWPASRQPQRRASEAALTEDRSIEGTEMESGLPPAIARLPGYILASPTQQAQHDDNQSSLH